MALKLKTEDVPEYAVIVSKSEAIQYQWKQIKDWKPQIEVWPFIHGLGFLGGLAAVSGMYINVQFRKSLKMKDFGFMASLFATSLSPGFLASILQMKFVTEKTLLPSGTCPLCMELRSIVTQNATAIGHPLILVPITNFMLCLRGQTHRIPKYTNLSELLRFCGYLYKPILPAIGVLSIINSIGAGFIVYKQFNCLSYMNQVLNLQNEEDEKLGEQKYLF